ncbi:MAG TPA: fatty acid desaturase [Rhizomicrobium sp.]|nr:fatty acid desaturase [Rhizomicrobium sp.]
MSAAGALSRMRVGELRSKFVPLARRQMGLPLLIFGTDCVLYATGIVGAVESTGLAEKLAFALLAGTFTALLAIVGHDAVHRSFTSSRVLNRLIGIFAFLPALHPYSRWEHLHNHVHHRFTSQLGLDNAYPPMTVSEYVHASPARRRWYRFKRSLAGQAVYYLIDVWLPKILMPSRTDRASFRRADWIDFAFVYLWLAGLIAALTALAHFSAKLPLGAAVMDAALFGVLLPFLVWNVLFSFVTFVQHTGPDVHWILPTGHPSTASEKLRGTAHVILPGTVDWFLHRAQQHPAHHIHCGIPLYALKRAQAEVEERWPRDTIAARWTLSYHWRLTRDCKLYDPEADCWCDFALRPTTGPRAV